MQQYGQFPELLPFFESEFMDTSFIPINLSALYDVILTCVFFCGGVWGMTKVIQLFKRR